MKILRSVLRPRIARGHSTTPSGRGRHTSVTLDSGEFPWPPAKRQTGRPMKLPVRFCHQLFDLIIPGEFFEVANTLFA